MDRELSDKRLDEWLDDALEDYGRAEPRQGIELRVQTRLKSRVARRAWRLRRQPVAWIAAAVTVVVIATAVRLGEHEKAPMPDFSAGYDEELLNGVGRMVHQNVPAALAPGTLLSKEITKEVREH